MLQDGGWAPATRGSQEEAATALLHVNDKLAQPPFSRNLRGSPISGKERELTGVSEQRSMSIGGGQRMEIQRLHQRGALTFDVQESGRIFFTACFLSRLSAIFQPIDKGGTLSPDT